MNETHPDKRTDYLTAKQLADHLQVSETTIHRLRRTGRIPAVYVTERLVRFNLKEVRRVLAKANDRIGSAGDAQDEFVSPQLGFCDLFEGFSPSEKESSTDNGSDG